MANLLGRLSKFGRRGLANIWRGRVHPGQTCASHQPFFSSLIRQAGLSALHFFALRKMAPINKVENLPCNQMTCIVCGHTQAVPPDRDQLRIVKYCVRLTARARCEGCCACPVCTGNRIKTATMMYLNLPDGADPHPYG